LKKQFVLLQKINSNQLNQTKGSSPFVAFYKMINQQSHMNE